MKDERGNIFIPTTGIPGLVLSDDVESARHDLEAQRDPKTIIAQHGGQENALASEADIRAMGGNRGGGKSYFLILDKTFSGEFEPHARMLTLRAALDDLTDLIDTSFDVYSEIGEYKKNEMKWCFQSGSFLAFNYHGGSVEDFCARFRGRQYCRIDIDEGQLMDFAKFKFLLTCLRNAYGYKNVMNITCNPDPDSWMAKVFDWWIGEDGYIIPERDGVIRYAFFDGDSPETIVWGDTRDEVYQKCRGIIDSMWTKEMEKYGDPRDIFIKSVTFVRAELTDNVALLQSDPSYMANIAGQSEQARARDFLGNWKFKAAGDDMISEFDMLALYENAEQVGNMQRYASCDAAFDGGDNLVLYKWVGWHIDDVAVCRKDSKHTIDFVRSKLKEWQVLERNFTYDLNGVGQTFKGFFPDAVPFNNREAVQDEYRAMYDCLKSQSAYMLVQKIRAHEISINPRILSLKFSGHGFTSVELRDILLKERRAIRPNESTADKGFTLIRKADMKKLVGHSPDFIEGLMMRMVFEIKSQHHDPRGFYSHSRPKIVFSKRRRTALRHSY